MLANGYTPPQKGKLPWTIDEAREMVTALRTSGLSCAQFAEHYGIHAERIRRWTERVAAADAVAATRQQNRSVGIIPVPVASTVATHSVAIADLICTVDAIEDLLSGELRKIKQALRRINP